MNRKPTGLTRRDVLSGAGGVAIGGVAMVSVAAAEGGKTVGKENADVSSLDLAPSTYHHHVMDNTEQALAYRGGDVAAWQARLGPELRRMVGVEPFERTQLNVRTLWRRDHPLGSIEKIVFTTEPHCDVTAYLCLPKESKPPHRFFICVQGHSTGMHNSIGVERDDESKPIEVEGDRDFALGAMKRGIAALCIEQRSFGQRRETALGGRTTQGCHQAAMNALLLGRTLIGERVYDVDRGIDYLASRGDVDMARLGVMGNSGGGTVSLFAAALLPRLRVAMPSCYFCTFRDSIAAMRHCECNYVPGIYKVAEMADVLGLFAPRPVVIVAGKDDSIFPLEATRREFARLQAIYRAGGAEEHCHLVVGQEGHRFYADEGWAAMLGEVDGAV